jgi:hypothetical protein
MKHAAKEEHEVVEIEGFEHFLAAKLSFDEGEAFQFRYLIFEILVEKIDADGPILFLDDILD